MNYSLVAENSSICLSIVALTDNQVTIRQFPSVRVGSLDSVLNQSCISPALSNSRVYWRGLLALGGSNWRLVVDGNDAVLTNLVDTKFPIVSNYTDIDGVVVAWSGEHDISVYHASNSLSDSQVSSTDCLSLIDIARII